MIDSIYRFGMRVKEYGERAGYRRRFWAGTFIRLGLAIRDRAMNGMHCRNEAGR